MDRPTRRQVLRVGGAVVVSGLAGCGTDGESGPVDDDVGNGLAGDDYPTIERWLTETQVGDAADTYDGTVEDLRERGTVTVEVGAPGNGGNFAYAPPAAVVSAGTPVEWAWTGEGDPHNVEAQPGEQIGESTYEFSSGDPVGGSGVEYTQMLAQPGVALYHCDPHLALGMKAGIAVE